MFSFPLCTFQRDILLVGKQFSAQSALHRTVVIELQLETQKHDLHLPALLHGMYFVALLHGMYVVALCFPKLVFIDVTIN